MSHESCSCDIICDISVETNNGQICHKFQTYLTFPGNYSGPNQVVMWYFHGVEIDLFSAEEISFNFHIDCNYEDPLNCDTDDYYEDGPIFKVEGCGIRMLQLRNELEPTGVEIVHVETDKPLPKRAKFSS